MGSVPKTPHLSYPYYSGILPPLYQDGPENLADSFESLNFFGEESDFSNNESSTKIISEKLPPHSSGSCDIFVGRLNSQKIEEELLRRRFGDYGEIVSLNLINRKRKGGIPQDAFAFITYKNPESAFNAIIREHGKPWMGQAIKVSYALPGQNKHTTNSMPNYCYPPPFHGYHPNMYPLVMAPTVTTTGGPVYGYAMMPTPYGYIPVLSPKESFRTNGNTKEP